VLIRTVLCVLLASASVATTGCATKPAPPPPPPPAAIATAPPPGHDIECHSETTTGTLIAKRVCLTKAQRDARDEAARRAQDTLSRSTATSCGGASAQVCPH
jgi:hypothetical protein